MSDWETAKLREVLTLNYGKNLTKKNRVPGEVPVYGSNGVVGSHNSALVKSEGIVVGRKGSAGRVHFSPVPFCPIDTTFFVTPDEAQVDIRFLYFRLLELDLTRILGDVGVPGLNREMAYMEQVTFPSDPSEQQKIAYVLSVVQRAMEQQERLIQTTTELKKALMQKLFTEGTRGEPQKQTEIGPVPQSWGVKPVGDHFQIKHGYAFDGNFFKPEGELILMTPGHFHETGGFRDQASKTKYYTGEVPNGYTLEEGDLVVAMTEQKAGLLASSAFVPGDATYLHNQRLGLIVELDETKLLKGFLFHLFNLPHFRREVAKTATGSKVKHTSPSKLRNVVVAIPTELDEQREIAGALDTVEKRKGIASSKLLSLSDLFKTLLHKLMTAEIRVHDIDLPGFEEYVDGS